MRCIQFIIALALAMPLLLGPGDGFAQGIKDDELRAAIIEMRNGQAAVLEELKAIRKLLEQGARPGVAAAPGAAEQAELTLRGIDGVAVRGAAEAALVLVEYTDYQCPFCGRHFADTVPSLASEYLDTGKLRYVLRDFPLESIHPQAFKAAEAARCAGDQGRYWEMHDALFRNQRALGQAQLTHYAKGIGLDVVAFEGCLDNGRHADTVRADIAEAQAAGITGTPTFFLAVEGGEPGSSRPCRRSVARSPTPRSRARSTRLWRIWPSSPNRADGPVSRRRSGRPSQRRARFGLHGVQEPHHHAGRVGPWRALGLTKPGPPSIRPPEQRRGAVAKPPLFAFTPVACFMAWHPEKRRPNS